jgi:perosamine synthetase
MPRIPLIKPYITQEVKDKVCEVLDSGYLTEGPVTKEFENIFKDYVGCGHAIAVTSCTTGLEIALRALGVGPGDEVIVPDYTYPATADVVSIVGATPVIVDVTRDTMLIDYDALDDAVTPKTKAVIPVSIFGNPLDYDKLNSIKKRRGVYMIEDAACSIGAEYKGVKVGCLTDISVFSLHPRKFITTGEGGVVTTDNHKLAAWMDSFKHFGMSTATSREGTLFERIGTNYKLSNILAAVGLVQMKQIDELLNRRIELAERYRELLRGVDGIQLPVTTAGGKHSYQSFCIFVENRDAIIARMKEDNIEAQIGTYAIHMHPAFARGKNMFHHGSLDGSRHAYDHCLTLPLYHEMTDSDQNYVVERLLDIVGSGY